MTTKFEFYTKGLDRLLEDMKPFNDGILPQPYEIVNITIKSFGYGLMVKVELKEG